MSAITTGKPQIGGGAWIAPSGTTLPTDATTALGATFKSLGFLSEDGLTNDDNVTAEGIKDWSGETQETIVTEHEDTWSCTLISFDDANVKKFVYGSSNVTVASGGDLESITSTGADAEEHVLVFETIQLNGKKHRIVIPRAKITERGTISYTSSDAVGHEVTITGLAENGATHKEFWG